MAKLKKRKFRRIIVDVNTQYDLVYNGNINYHEMIRNFRRLFAWSRVERIPVVSISLCRRPVSCPDLYDQSDIYCLEGDPGQKKINYTTLSSNITFSPDHRMDLPRHLMNDYQQIVFEIRGDDPFDMPRADRLLSELKADQFVVFGVGLTSTLKHTVLGLLRREKTVTVVRDAVDNSKSGFEMNLRKLETKGASLSFTSDLAGKSKLSGKITKRSAQDTAVLTNARVR